MTAVPIPINKPSASVIVVDPSTAERWLGQNTRNRKVRQRVVNTYAKDMREGNWQLTGEAIKFASDGTLLDGQHRLLAVIASGVSVHMFVVRGLAVQAQDVMDTGSIRAARDMLEMYGVGNSTLAASSAKWIILFEEKRLYVDRTQRAVTHSDILLFAEDNETHRAAIQFTSSIRRLVDLQPAILATAVYLTLLVDADDAREFFTRVADGVGLPAGSPILALRSRLREIKSKRQRVEPEALLSITMRAWNAWRSGRNMASIPIYKGGSSIRCPEPR